MRRRDQKRYCGYAVLIASGFIFWKLLTHYHKSPELNESVENVIKANEVEVEKKVDSQEMENVLQRPDGRTLEGLTTRNGEFVLGSRPLRILAGEIHYFRIPHQYWHDRLLALKACGLNTVTTYIPWNAHEPKKNTYDFTEMLNLPLFVKTAQKLGLFVILRIGPYICAEWDYGGLPSWLLKEKYLRVRTSDTSYMKHVTDWFNKLLPMVKEWQYTRGGPVIAIQVENEYGAFPEYDSSYVRKLHDMVIDSGIKEFLFVCDDVNGIMRKDLKLAYGNMLRTVNMQTNANGLKELEKAQPNMPMFVSEYWTGWFDWWGGAHNGLGVPWMNTFTADAFEKTTQRILSAGASINLYMFVGGTNFGFMNGAYVLSGEHFTDTTSYDYTALITEGGQLTDKYHALKRVLKDYSPSIQLLSPPPDPILASYDGVTISEYVELSDLLVAFKDWMFQSLNPISMEHFPARKGLADGQSHGFALYETSVTGETQFKFDFDDKIRDRAVIFLDTVYQDTITTPAKTLSLQGKPGSKHTVSFLVENMGRVNWVSREMKGVMNDQQKGIIGDIKCNNEVLLDWRIWPLEFDGEFLKKLKQLTEDGTLDWNLARSSHIRTPALIKTKLYIDTDGPQDTFVELKEFEKGIVIVNGHNLGRYWNSAGPQQRLYLPRFWLHQGVNEILIFEEKKAGSLITFHDSSGM